MSDDGKTNGLPGAGISRLRDLRRKLLHLHKSLLDMERADFEKMFGSVNSGELLQLVINGTQFAWLRRISALVVEVDEILDQDEPAKLSDREDLITQVRRLLTSPEDEEFGAKYQAALQRQPTVVMNHAEVMKLLR